MIRSTEWGVTETRDVSGKRLLIGSADPSNIWMKDGRYYMLTGNLLVLNKVGREPDTPLSEQGDRLYLFVSDDLEDGEYLGVFANDRQAIGERRESNPPSSFLPLFASSLPSPISQIL